MRFQFLLVAALLALVSSVWAVQPTVRLGYEYGASDTGTAQTDQARIGLGYGIGKRLVADARLGVTRMRVADSITARPEARLAYALPWALEGTKFSVRGTLGESLSNTASFGFWAGELLAKRQVGLGFWATASYRYRTSFDYSERFMSNTYKVGLGRSVLGHDLEVKPFIQRGDSDINGVELEFTL